MYLDSVLRIYYLAEFKYFVYGLYCNLNMPDLQNKDSPLCLIKMKILKKNIPKRHCLVFLVCFTWFCSGPVLESGNYTLSGLQSAKTLLFVAPSCCIIYTVVGKIRPYLPCFGTSLLRFLSHIIEDVKIILKILIPYAAEKVCPMKLSGGWTFDRVCCAHLMKSAF